ncbi:MULTISPECIES: phage tail tip fiber protein [Pseudomonas]|uniref:phage tail tip fiber protein n=1 Tax=Pseudomonas TaxID=286 RepID=UPI00338F096C
MLEFRNYFILKAGERSEFLIFAPRFAVVNEIDGIVIPMFVVQNNQVVSTQRSSVRRLFRRSS